MALLRTQFTISISIGGLSACLLYFDPLELIYTVLFLDLVHKVEHIYHHVRSARC
jgi:hypothetical protein